MLYLGNACFCTSEYDVDLGNGIAQAYCKGWHPGYPGDVYCYLSGGLSSSSCPGAAKSAEGDFYWTRDQTICNQAIGK